MSKYNSSLKIDIDLIINKEISNLKIHFIKYYRQNGTIILYKATVLKISNRLDWLFLTLLINSGYAYYKDSHKT